MKALVTGARGFLGTYVVEQLAARGDRVRAFCRKTSPRLDALGAETVLGDVRDAAVVADACQGVDVVFHVAGVAGIWGPWSYYHGINTLGTCNVVAGCRRHGVGRLVYTSSPSVTFDGSAQRGVDESAPYARRWLCHYPHSKALAEEHVLESNGCDGLRTCALRPHLIWGPGDRQLVPRLVERARRGRLRRVGDGTNRIDMSYVENVAEAHLMAADALQPGSPVAGRAYFISQGEPVNCWQWINQILDLAGLPPVQKKISLAAAWRMGAVLEAACTVLGVLYEPPMTRFLAAQLGEDHFFDISRAMRDFGYRPKISTAEGMRRLAVELAAPGGKGNSPSLPKGEGSQVANVNTMTPGSGCKNT